MKVGGCWKHVRGVVYSRYLSPGCVIKVRDLQRASLVLLESLAHVREEACKLVLKVTWGLAGEH